MATEHETDSAVTTAGAQLADIEALYRMGHDRFVAVAAVLCGDADNGRDAVQDGFAQAIRSRASFRGEGTLEGWVWRIVVNAARSSARKPWPATVADVPERGQAPAAEAGVDLLHALPDRQRTVLFLRYYADLDYRAIAEILDVEIGTVGSTLNAALAALRRGMARKVTE